MRTAADRVRVARLSTSHLRRHYWNCAQLWKKCPLLWLKWIFTSGIDLLRVCFVEVTLVLTQEHRATERHEQKCLFPGRNYSPKDSWSVLFVQECKWTKTGISHWQDVTLLCGWFSFFVHFCVLMLCLYMFCILNMLLLSPAGQTRHCTPSSPGPDLFFFARKVNIIKNRCGWSRANSFSSVMNYVCMDFLPQITSSGLLMTAQQNPSKPCWLSGEQIDSRGQKEQLWSRDKALKS